MADNIQQQGGELIAYDNVSGAYYQRVKLSVGEDGSVEDAKQINGKLRVSAMPYLYDIAEGNVTGHTPWSKIGYNTSVGTSEEDLWTAGSMYAWPAATGIGMQVVSSNAADDGDPAGTGVRTAIIQYLNDTGAELTETVTMNGTATSNTTAVKIVRINGFRAVTCGASEKAVGTITLKDTSATTTYAQISIGYTRDRNASYSVPTGKALYITSIIVSTYNATKGVRFTVRSTYDSDSAVVRDFFIPILEINITNGSAVIPIEMPIKVPAGGRVKVSAISDADGAVCSVAMQGWLETV